MRTLSTALLACTASALTAQMGCDSLNTTYLATVVNHGAMFNLVAATPVTLDHITANLYSGTADCALYYRNGNFHGTSDGQPPP